MSEQKTYTLEDLQNMPVSEVNKLLNTPGATFYGTAVVRGPDGKPKYDDPAKAGEYMETENG